MNGSNSMERLRVLLKLFHNGANKSLLNDREQRRLRLIKLAYNNVREDGFWGGEGGTSDNWLKHQADWIESLVQSKSIPIPEFDYDGWPLSEYR